MFIVPLIVSLAMACLLAWTLKKYPTNLLTKQGSTALIIGAVAGFIPQLYLISTVYSPTGTFELLSDAPITLSFNMVTIGLLFASASINRGMTLRALHEVKGTQGIFPTRLAVLKAFFAVVANITFTTGAFMLAA